MSALRKVILWDSTTETRIAKIFPFKPSHMNKVTKATSRKGDCQQWVLVWYMFKIGLVH